MTARASGTFDVTLTPKPLADEHADASLARMSIEKRFHGDLDATSKGEMLSAATAVQEWRATSPSNGWRARCTGATARSCSSTAAR